MCFLFRGLNIVIIFLITEADCCFSLLAQVPYQHQLIHMDTWLQGLHSLYYLTLPQVTPLSFVILPLSQHQKAPSIPHQVWTMHITLFTTCWKAHQLWPPRKKLKRMQALVSLILQEIETPPSCLLDEVLSPAPPHMAFNLGVLVQVPQPSHDRLHPHCLLQVSNQVLWQKGNGK